MFGGLFGNLSMERIFPLFKKEFEDRKSKCLLITFEDEKPSLVWFEKNLVDVLRDLQNQNIELRRQLNEVS